MKRARRGVAGIAAAIWVGLALIYIPLTRQVQPSLLMTVLAVSILTSGSALLLAYGRSAWRRWCGAARLAMTALGVAAVGTGAALLIRLLYAILEPDVTPFGLAFNIATDTLWVAAHALIVGALLDLIARRFASGREWPERSPDQAPS